MASYCESMSEHPAKDPFVLSAKVRAGHKQLIAEGASVDGQILEIGNTRYSFSTGVPDFIKSWNSHDPALTAP